MTLSEAARNGFPSVRHAIAGFALALAGVATDASWDNSRKVLQGSSQTVKGDRYTITILAPPRFVFTRVSAISGGKPIAVEHQLAGSSLTIGFDGQTAAFEWKVEFEYR